MKMIKHSLVLCILMAFSSLWPAGITYQFSGGRLGDNLLAYCHARWISYKYGIPFLYRPFKYSDQFELHFQHPFFDLDDLSEFQHVENFAHLTGKHNEYPFLSDAHILYLLPYFPDCQADIEERFHFDVGWNDPGFKALLKKEIASNVPIQLLELPKGRAAVAVHIRTGAGYDKVAQFRPVPGNTSILTCQSSHCLLNVLEKTPVTHPLIPVKPAKKSMFADKLHPLKFPPNSFYVEQLKRLSELLHDKPLYVHVFTDSTQPEAFVDLLNEAVGKPNIVYACRSEGNHQDAHVLDDFFSLTQFEYVIRGESNFTIMAGKITDYKIVIYPAECAWQGNTLLITAAFTEIRQKNGEVTLLKTPVEEHDHTDVCTGIKGEYPYEL